MTIKEPEVDRSTLGPHDWTHLAESCDVPGCDHVTRRTCEGAERVTRFLRQTLNKRTALLCKADPTWAALAEENLFRAMFSEEMSGAGRPPRIYAASRASVSERPAMWRRLRDEGHLIVSTWIDEAGPGETASFADLWQRGVSEIRNADRLVLYAEPDDFPLKGALVEVGVALGAGIPVYVVAPGVEIGVRDYRPIGSWLAHPLVQITGSIEAALAPWPEASWGGRNSPMRAAQFKLTTTHSDGSKTIEVNRPMKSGWRRINASARYHFWQPWQANEFLLIPLCKRELFLSRGAVLKKRDELPAGATLCRGCSGSPELRFSA